MTNRKNALLPPTDYRILAALRVRQAQDKKIDTIVERYRINTNEIFQERRHLRYHYRRYPLIIVSLMMERREPTEVDLNTNLTFATSGFPQLTFVLVNERMPRNDAHCALCGGAIEKGYVRDFRTRLIYCDTQCFAGGAYSVTKDQVRKVS
jgi:hypothetical protein